MSASRARNSLSGKGGSIDGMPSAREAVDLVFFGNSKSVGDEIRLCEVYLIEGRK
jgi:hypothetical protein